MTALFDAAVAEHGRLDVLVNNAGVGAVAPSEELTFDVWSRTLAVNLTGTFLCAQAAARHMLPAGRGVIVNIGSLFAATGMPMRAAYAASKHGVVGLTKVLATEWASRGVRVVAVDPAYVAHRPRRRRPARRRLHRGRHRPPHPHGPLRRARRGRARRGLPGLRRRLVRHRQRDRGRRRLAGLRRLVAHRCAPSRDRAAVGTPGLERATLSRSR